MKPQYKVLIVGAGKIGAFFDTPKSKNILTHAHAFTKHKGFRLLGFIDIDQKKAQKAAAIWGGKAFSNLEKTLNQEKVDIVVVSVPDNYHYEILKNISHFPLKLVLAEKPITKTLKEAVKISKLYQEKKIPVAVNYTRRFVPEFEKLKKNISRGIYGQYITGTGYYGKGTLNNGSHLIDLLRFLIGEIKDIEVIDDIVDYSSDDPSASAILKLKNNQQFYLQNVDCRLFTIFEIDLLFEKSRVVIKDLGFNIEKYKVKESKIFKGYKDIIRVCQTKTSLDKALYYAADNIYNFLFKGKHLKCTLEDGYRALEICTKILKKINHE